MVNPNKAFSDKHRKIDKQNGLGIGLIFTEPKVLNLQCCTAGCGAELNLSVDKGEQITPDHIPCPACGASYWEWYASDVHTV